jgi:hypothetical protein
LTSITRRVAIPLGLAALAPAASRAGGRCRKQRNKGRHRFGSGGVCTPDRNAIYVAIANYFEDQSIVSVTLTPAVGSPQVLNPDGFSSALATSVVENGAPLCRTS